MFVLPAVVLLGMIIGFERQSHASIGDGKGCMLNIMNFTRITPAFNHIYQSASENMSQCCAQAADNLILKSWISLAAASLLSMLVVIIHSHELMSIYKTEWTLIGCSFVTAALGVVLGFLAVRFVQLAGYALLGTSFLSSLSGYFIAVHLQNNLETTATSIQTVHTALEEIVPTPPQAGPPGPVQPGP